jgi:RNA polymerase sigma-70 factor (ECF subfamily)
MDLPVPDTLLADLGAEQRRALIDEALRKLPPHQRVPLVLYHFEDLSYEEIAVKLHASLAKIKTDIRRARAALLPYLESSGVAADGL